MRKLSFLMLALAISFSLGSVKATAAEVVVVRSAPHRHHYVLRDGYYWEGPQAYRRVWIARSHRYDYRPVHVVERRTVVVHDDRGHHDDHYDHH